MIQTVFGVDQNIYIYTIPVKSNPFNHLSLLFFVFSVVFQVTDRSYVGHGFETCKLSRSKGAFRGSR